VLLVVENVSLARDHRLRKQATSLRAAGYDVTVICRRDPDNHQLEGIHVLDYRAPADAGSHLAFLWEYAYSWTMAAFLTWRAYLSHPFDVIQISGMPDIYFAIAAPFRLLGVPLVLDQPRPGSGGLRRAIRHVQGCRSPSPAHLRATQLP